MNTVRDDFIQPFERLLADHCAPTRVRNVEAGASVAELWKHFHDSGFLDALMPESRSGAGLNLSEIFPLVYLCGSYAAPIPIAQTLLCRAIWTAAARAIPTGPITIAGSAATDGRAIECASAPYGLVARWVAISLSDRSLLLPLDTARVTPTGVYGSLEAHIRWETMPAALTIDTPIDLQALGACLYAAQLAGAMSRALEMTLRYANERSQFGRSIGKFQAIQHQLSVMAEHVTAARMAAQIGCHSGTHIPDTRFAAVAKARTSEAAVAVAAIAHAVHGAMGFTAEYDLQLYTRRLHEWRLAYGSEAYWMKRIGAELLGADGTMLDFIRGNLFPQPV
jgi:acyl-CoA dehydrogenase